VKVSIISKRLTDSLYNTFTYVICRLAGPYREKLWPRSWKYCPGPQAESSIFKPEVTVLTCLFFFSCSKLVLQVTNGFVYATLSLNRLARRLVTICKNLRNERVTQIVDKQRCIKEQIFFELLYVSCIYFTSQVLQNLSLRCEISCEVWSFEYKNNLCQSLLLKSLDIRLFYPTLNRRKFVKCILQKFS